MSKANYLLVRNRLDDAPVCSQATPEELDALFDEPLPEVGASPEEVFERFARDVVPHAMNIPSPRYFGLFNPTPLPVAVWADALISALNQNGAAWRNSPSASAVEAPWVSSLRSRWYSRSACARKASADVNLKRFPDLGYSLTNSKPDRSSPRTEASWHSRPPVGPIGRRRHGILLYRFERQAQ